MANNIVTATFNASHFAVTPSIYRYNYGNILVFEGIENLPEYFEVHFANRGDTTTTPWLGQDGQVIIPNDYLQTGKQIVAYIYLHETAADGETVYKVIIPVRDREEPEDVQPTPEQQTALEAAIYALNTETGVATEAAESAEASAVRAEEAAASIDEGMIAEAVADYLDEHPITVDETDPTVPSWAKQPTKPSYTPEEIGAVPAEAGKGLSTNDYTTAEKQKLAGIEAGADKTPDLSGYATKTELNGKVDKVSGKGLSTNDYTTAEKNKLDGIEAGAQKNPDLSHYVTDSDYDPDSKTSAQTQPVGVDANGKLWTAPGGGGSGLTEDAKQALLQIAQKVAYIDAHGEDYYRDLYDALYPPENLVSISATFNQGSTVVYDTDSLDSLKPMLTVTATYDDQSTTVVNSYTLSGTLTTGISTITVTYQGKTDTFTVNVTHEAGVYSVTNNLTGATNSNSATSVTEGNSYSGTIAANAGYTLTGATVSITMGETDITSTAYSNGTISIASATGNISISVVAAAAEATLSSISADFTQGQNVIYNTDSLDTLKQYLVVTATYSDSSTATISASAYTLSGTLTVGTSTITVSYGGKTTTFTCTVTAAPSNTTAQLDTANMNKGQSNTFGNYTSKTGFCPTIKYQLGTLSVVNGGNYDYLKGIIPVDATGSTTCRIWFYKEDNSGVTGSAYGSGKPMNAYDESMTEGAISVTASSGFVSMTIPCHVDYLDDSYLYVQSSGKVLFAGRNTPYYGMENISEAS